MTPTISHQNLISIPEGMSDVRTCIFLARCRENVTNILRPYVYKVFSENSWKEDFNSFTEFITSPEGLNMSQGYGDKLKNTYKYFVIDGGIPAESIVDIPTESLQLAKGIKMIKGLNGVFHEATVEEQVEMARLNKREELKSEFNDGENCDHSEHGDCCFKCWTKLPVK